MKDVFFGLSALALVSVLTTPTAIADPMSWVHVPVSGGCYVVADGALPHGATVSWTGQCVSGQPLSGAGEMRVDFGNGSHGSLQSTFVAGVPNGPSTLTMTNPPSAPQVRQATYHMGCASADLTPNCTPYTPR